MNETAVLGSRGHEQAARDRFLEYARAHEGTAAGGSALVSAANLTYSRLGDQATGRALFAEASQKYPGSMIEVGARSNLATWDYNATQDDAIYIAAMSQISTELGGPSVQQVLTAGDDTVGLAAQVKGLHPETQLGLWHVFKNVYYSYKATDFEKALTIAKFGRSVLESAALNGDESFSYFLVDLLIEHHNLSGPFGTVPSAPEATILAPAQGSIVPPNPTLQLRITTGNYHNTTVDLTRLGFKVDGVDRRYEVIVKNDLDLSFSESANFETLTLSLPTTLQPGPHTASIYVVRSKVNDDPPTGPVGETITWSFTVSGDTTPPGPTTETLPALKDALIDNFDPNGNEGANGILALDKLLGRGSRSLVAFDLSGVDTNRLSKATLVLSIHKKEKILGCGPGEKISVQALTNSWVEGNGKTYKVLPWTARRRGNGAGATWNRDTDSNIANIVANGGYAWKGAQSATIPRTAPLVVARDHMEGTLQFDVTDDVLNGAPHGWLLRKQHENLASRISFYSKEGAVAAGNPDLAPKLILEYDGPTAYLNRGASAVASFLGLPRRGVNLQEIATDSEIPTLRDILRRNPKVALVGERLVFGFIAHHQPLVELGARAVYRSWLQGEPRLG